MLRKHNPTGLFHKAVAVLAAWMLLASAALAQRQQPEPRAAGAPHHDQAPAGLVLVVDGVGGWDVMMASAQKALPRAGVRHEVRGYEWTHGRGKMLKDLQDLRYLMRKADDLALEIQAYRGANPGRPVYLLAKSGGAGLALAAAERLPPQSLERIVLLSAAVSPDYDLRPALLATRKEIVSFHSPRDQIILHWGTNQFGTIDRHYGPSAGLHGFVVPEVAGSERAHYDRLVQVAWKPGMAREGNLGTHFGTSMPAFLSREVAPWFIKP